MYFETKQLIPIDTFASYIIDILLNSSSTS